MTIKTVHPVSRINDLRYDIGARRMDLERLILQTPSGERRNLLTEANILLMTVEEKITEAAKPQ